MAQEEVPGHQSIQVLHGKVGKSSKKLNILKWIEGRIRFFPG
jgi:hypothetical protein